MRFLLGLFVMSPFCVVALVAGVLVVGRPSSLPLGTIGIVTILVSIVLYSVALVYFLYMVETDPQLEAPDRARWTYVLLLWFPFGAITYWYRRVWRTPK